MTRPTLSVFLISSPEWYLVRCRQRNAPSYVVFSTRLLPHSSWAQISSSALYSQKPSDYIPPVNVSDQLSQPYKTTPYAEEIIGDHQCGFRCNRSTTDHIFCIRQILEKKWEYNGAVHQLFVDFKKAYDSVRREVLYNILIEFGVPLILVRLIKMCLNETYSRVRVGKHLSDRFLMKSGLE
jgi:hypothetical protein